MNGNITDLLVLQFVSVVLMYQMLNFIERLLLQYNTTVQTTAMFTDYYLFLFILCIYMKQNTKMGVWFGVWVFS